MNNLTIEATKKTPDVLLDANTGELNISGMSCSENALGFYAPVFDWINSYVSSPKDETTINFKLKYYNTSSAKCLLDLMDRVMAVKESGKQVIINSYYDPNDDEMLESGENYSTILDHPFNLLAI